MSKSVKKQILALENEQAAAINRRKTREAVKMFVKDFVGFSSTRHKRIHGLGALSRTFQHYMHRAPRMRYRIEQPEVLLSGDTAVATFYWRVDLGPLREVVKGRGTHVFVRNGKDWRVVHEHFSRAH